MIRWSQPTVTNGKISEYIIQRRSSSEQSNIFSVAKVAANNSREYLDNSVVPCSRYDYRVIAFTKKGGAPSPWSNITTQEGGKMMIHAIQGRFSTFFEKKNHSDLTACVILVSSIPQFFFYETRDKYSEGLILFVIISQLLNLFQDRQPEV